MVQAWFMGLHQGPEGPVMQLVALQDYGVPVTAVGINSMHSAALCEGAQPPPPSRHHACASSRPDLHVMHTMPVVSEQYGLCRQVPGSSLATCWPD